MPVDKSKFASRNLIQTLQVGDILVYLARPEDRPIDPNKEWHGKVLYICIHNDRMLDHVKVESLEPGEEGLTEFVYPQQMLRKESGQAQEG